MSQAEIIPAAQPSPHRERAREAASRTVSESQSEMTELVLPNDANTLGNLLGGRLMHFIDLVGAMPPIATPARTSSPPPWTTSTSSSRPRRRSAHPQVQASTAPFNTSMEVVGSRSGPKIPRPAELPPRRTRIPRLRRHRQRATASASRTDPRTPDEHRRYEGGPSPPRQPRSRIRRRKRAKAHSRRPRTVRPARRERGPGTRDNEAGNGGQRPEPYQPRAQPWVSDKGRTEG